MNEDTDTLVDDTLVDLNGGEPVPQNDGCSISAWRFSFLTLSGGVMDIEA